MHSSHFVRKIAMNVKNLKTPAQLNQSLLNYLRSIYFPPGLCSSKRYYPAGTDPKETEKEEDRNQKRRAYFSQGPFGAALKIQMEQLNADRRRKTQRAIRQDALGSHSFLTNLGKDRKSEQNRTGLGERASGYEKKCEQTADGSSDNFLF